MRHGLHFINVQAQRRRQQGAAVARGRRRSDDEIRMLAGVNVFEHAESRGQGGRPCWNHKGVEQIAVGIQQGGLMVVEPQSKPSQASPTALSRSRRVTRLPACRAVKALRSASEANRGGSLP